MGFQAKQGSYNVYQERNIKMTSKSSSSAHSASSKDKASLKAGADIIVDTLIELGVDTMFGYPGGVVLPLFDSLYDAPINFVIPRHEQGACHMERSALS